MTLRDSVWDESLMLILNRGKFRTTDLPFDESQRHTVRRTLKEMEDRDWLRRDTDRSPVWRLGPKAEMVLDVSPDVVEASTQ